MKLIDRMAERYRSVISNWEQPLPLGTKIRLTARNAMLRLVKRQSCCGHDGEPGC